MTGRITLVGAGELMSAMSPLHRAAFQRLGRPVRPVFLDTTAGFETNVDAIGEKAVEYYAHHLQTELRIASYRNRERASPAELAAAVATIRDANLIFAGPGSPTYAIRQWRGSTVWQAVEEQFEAGADIFFASAASIALGRYSLPVYEIYKAGEDPFWVDGMDVLGRFGLNVAVIPHYNDNSGGENYDSRFCYMGAERFDKLQAYLPPEVTILGIDAYTAISLDPATAEATVSGQGGITLIGEGDSRRLEAGASLPFEALHSSSREIHATFNESERVKGYGSTDIGEDTGSPLSGLSEKISALASLSESEKVDLLAELAAAQNTPSGASEELQGHLLDLVLELRQGLREAKRFDLADRARDILVDAGFEIQDTPEGARWTRT